MFDLKRLNEDFDDDDNLRRFQVLLSHFNNGKPISNELKVTLEQYFEYYWKNNKSIAISD